ncbi:MAG: competence protein TfoX [candidate division Zixibacteria bacterium SM23_81]|nr:MAG: competence protein TfoX [candidate division Zixibacteria bacterium SM23_81]
MPVSQSYRQYVLDQLQALGGVTARSMFGGAGLYRDGLIFGILANDTLYFKVDDSNLPDYKAADMGPFCPYGTAMPYYQVPIAVLEDPETLRVWAEKALVVARWKSEEGGRKRGTGAKRSRKS